MEASSLDPMASFPTSKGSTLTQTLQDHFLHPIILGRGCQDNRALVNTPQQGYPWASIISKSRLMVRTTISLEVVMAIVKEMGLLGRW